MASKQALDGKYTMWFRSQDAYRRGAAPYTNSDCTFNCRFQGLPDCKLFILKCEQYALAGNDTGDEYRAAIPGGAAAGQLVPTAYVTIDGFSSIPGSQNWQGLSFLNTKPGVVLSRFSTNSGKGDPDDDCVTPNQTPSTIVHKPQSGDFTIKLMTTFENPAGTDLALLAAATGAAGPLIPVKNWGLCISLQGIPDSEADRYFAR